MCPIGQCIQAPTDQVGGVSSRTGKSSLRTPSQRDCVQKCAQHAYRKMPLALCPAQILNESFSICISNQGRDADLCSCLKHSSGKDFEALQGFQTHSLPAFFFFFLLCIPLWYRFIPQQPLFSTFSYPISPLFNNSGILENHTVPGQLTDSMLQNVSLRAGLTTIYFSYSPISKVSLQGWVKVWVQNLEPSFPCAVKFGVIFQIHPLNRTGFQCSDQNNPYLICLLAAKQQEDCQYPAQALIKNPNSNLIFQTLFKIY